MAEQEIREVVIPGEVISEDSSVLPGEGTEKRDGKIVAIKYGLIEKADRLIKVIPLSGVYQARRGNQVIGKVENITFNGWVIDIEAADNAFLSINEVPRYVNKDGLEEIMEIGDMVVAKIWGVNRRGIDLSIKNRGLGKIDEGLIIRVNPHKVPRIIGREGSMVNLIKEHTNCNITVGQNGLIWLNAEKIEEELLARDAINFVAENSFISGLTDAVEDWFKKVGGKK